MIEVLRLLLAAIFAVAGVAKLLDREGSRRAARAFGAPGWLGVALPVVELAIAIALVPTSTARAAASAAAGLLVLFSVAIANAVLRGQKPDCGCFGKLHSAPASWRTIVRNVALAGFALAVASQPAGALSWVDVAVAAVAILVVAQTILAYTLFRRYGRALARIEALEAPQEEPVSSPVPVAGNGSARVALAGAAAGALAATAAVAHASPDRYNAPPTDPELRVIYDALRAGGPKLVAAAERSRKAIRNETSVLKGKTLRVRRSAARTALAGERREVLALRTRIESLPATAATAHNVKVMIHSGLTLRAQSLEKHQRAVGAAPKTARKLLNESQRLFVGSLGSMMAAGKALQESK